MVRTFITVTYIPSMCDPEVLLLDLNGLNGHWKEGIDHHFIIALSGKIKGEHNARCHLLPCVSSNAGTGLRIQESMKQFLNLKAGQDLMDGPALSKENGHLF